jgi:hypothetical protein
MAPRSTEGETLRLPGPWAAVGRDTAAGRALFALYNGFGQARNRGNQYSSTNKIKILKHIAKHGPVEFPVQKPPPPTKPKVKVPHFYPKNALMEYYNSLCPVELMRGRRKASEILEQSREDAAIVEVPPQPKGPLLDAKEKARLQEVFYWANRDLGPDPPLEEKPMTKPPKRGSVQEKEMLLNAILKEIEDREAFLTEMDAYGKADKYRSQITAEIQDRMNQLFMLHDQLSMAERAGVEHQCHLATKILANSKRCPDDCNNINSTSPELSPSENEHEQEQEQEQEQEHSTERSSSCDHQLSASSPNPSCRSSRPSRTNQPSSVSSPRDTVSERYSPTETRESNTPNSATTDTPNSATTDTPKSATTTHRTTPQNTIKNTKHLTIKVPRSVSSNYGEHNNCNSTSTRTCSPISMASNTYHDGGSNANAKSSPRSFGVDNIGSDVNESAAASPTPSSTTCLTTSSTKCPNSGRSNLWSEEMAKSRSRRPIKARLG